MSSSLRWESLANGFTLLAESIPGVRSASFTLLVRSGAVTDPEGEEGISALLEGMVYRGAGGRDSRALSDALDALGLQRGGGAELENTSFRGTLLSEDLESALELYRDIVRHPRLPEKELPAQKALALQALQSLEDRPQEKMFVELRKIYFGKIYGRSSYGTREGLSAVTAASLQAYHRRRYALQGAILAVAGKFHWESLRKKIKALFQDWGGEPASPPVSPDHGKPSYTHLEKETSQVQIGIIYPGVPLEHSDYYDHLMSYRVLSGGMGARLFTEVREKRGLVYSVYAGGRVLKGLGTVYAYAGTTPERAQETLEVLSRELVRIREGVSEEEVDRSRTGLVSSLIMQEESSGARAAGIASDYYLIGRVRPLEEIQKSVERVTPETIRAALERQPPGNFCVMTMGPKALKYNTMG